MAWWPWRRPGGEPVPAAGAPAPAEQPTAPVQRSGEWAELPPLQRVLEQPVAPVAPLDVFRANLTTSRDPSFLAPLTHRVDPSAGGLVEGIAGAVAPRVHPVGSDLPVLPRPSAPAPRVQRHVGSRPSPVDAAVPTSVPEPAAAPQAQVAEPEAVPQVVAVEQLEPPAVDSPAVDSPAVTSSAASPLTVTAPVGMPTAVVTQRVVTPAAVLTPDVTSQAATSQAVTSQAVTSQAVTSQAVTPVEPEPTRTLAVVVPPDPPRAEQPALPLAQLPVVSRLAAASAAATPPRTLPVHSEDASAPAAGDDAPPAVTMVEVPTTRSDEAAAGAVASDPVGPRSEQQQSGQQESAPLSGFAAAIAAIGRGDVAAPRESVRPQSTAPNEMPAQRSAVGAPQPQGRLNQPAGPPGPAAGPSVLASASPAAAPPEAVVEPAGPAPLAPEPVAGTSDSAANSLDEWSGASQDQPLLGEQPLGIGVDEPAGARSADLGSSDGPELAHVQRADPTPHDLTSHDPASHDLTSHDLTSHDPASGERELTDLPVVSRAVDHGAARAAGPTSRAVATPVDAPTLGAATPGEPAGHTATAGRTVTTSPVLQRRAEVVPAQPVRFLPVEAAGPSRPTTNPSRSSAVEPRGGSGSSPLPAAAPAVVAQRSTDAPRVPQVPGSPPAGTPGRPAGVALQRWTESVGSVSTATAAMTPAASPRQTSEPAVVLQRLVEQPHRGAVAAAATGAPVSTAGSTAGRTGSRSGTATPVVLRQTASAPVAPAGLYPPTAPAPAALLTVPSRGTSFTQMFTSSASGGSADGGVPGVQREAPESTPDEPAPVPPSSDASATGGAPGLTGGAAATTAAASAAGPSTDVEELARRLYEPLSARLRAELWLDRERAGV